MMIHKTVKWIIPTMLILGALMFLAMSGVYVAQILLPERCRWLSPEEIQQLHSILFSSFVGGAIALAGKTYLDTPSGKSN
ncbi:exported hypothetical protein [Novosphingobium sp. KN65.2]|nr:exported hypothetical protein [Novosphingobium sp. KN65.2]